ncbi:MAG: flagellar hook-associated protein FlgK [Planctomycetota bacterium]
MAMYSIGVSALQAAQRALEVTGHNIANANTPGYHRQVPKLASQSAMQLGGQSIGRGVELIDIQRAVNAQLESSLTQQVTENGATGVRLSTMFRLESRWSTEGASPAGRLEILFNDLEQLSTRLNDGASRKVVLSTAASTAREFNSLATDMYQMREDLDRSLIEVVNEINPLVKQIATFNVEIARLTSQGISPNDLLDQRNQLVNELAERLPIEIQNGNQGQITILAAGTPLVIAGSPQEVVMGASDSGATEILVAGSDSPLQITGGRLGGLLDLRNTQLGAYHVRLDELARAVSRAFDGVQSTGVGVDGGFGQLNGQRGVKDVTAKLDVAGLGFPPQAGSLFVTMTNTATGAKTITEVAINPATQSLQDVAAALSSAVPNFSAFVNTQVGTLSLNAAPGYKFDFTGGVDPNSTTTFTAGTTTTATMGGVYTGAANDVYNVTFLSSGTVGVTPGLQARVTNQAGEIVTTLDIGQGYEAGQPLLIANGVTVSLAVGAVASGDSFATKVVGQPDTAGLLTALGLNTFFSGDDAATLKLNADLAGNPNRLATSRTGQPGDASNLQRLIALRDSPILNDGQLTFSKAYNLTVADIGTEVRALSQLHDTNQLLTDRIQSEIQSDSGVDPNEEMVEVLKYQRMFQMAAKYINTVNDTFEDLLRLQ